MSKYLVVAVGLALAACGSKQEETPAVGAAAESAPAAATPAAADSTKPVETTKMAGDTAKAP